MIIIAAKRGFPASIKCFQEASFRGSEHSKLPFVEQAEVVLREKLGAKPIMKEDEIFRIMRGAQGPLLQEIF